MANYRERWPHSYLYGSVQGEVALSLPAGFFLKLLRGGRCDLRDLPSLDAQVGG